MSGFAAAEQKHRERLRQQQEEQEQQQRSSSHKDHKLGISEEGDATGEDRPLWERRLATAKAEHRPKLKNWSCDAYGNWSRDGYGVPSRKAHAFDAFAAARIVDVHACDHAEVWAVQSASQRDGTQSVLCSLNANGRGVPRVPAAALSLQEFWDRFTSGIQPRVPAAALSLQEFWDRFEAPELPVIIQNVPRDENWGAAQEDAWSFERLDRVYGEVRMKCGEDDDGYSIKVRLKHFVNYVKNQQALSINTKFRLMHFSNYVKNQQDDSPLYIFDSHFDEHDVGKALLQEYRVPSYFPDDLFELVGERRRPPYRWFLVGPKRSGTCCHIDPLGTSAWNTVLVGRKRWVIFPPQMSRSLVKGKTVIRDKEDDEAINYFIEHLPRIRTLAARDTTIKMYEFIQYPGETVFIPGGWWHAVINLDDTVAVTQNFCSRVNFPKVWAKTRGDRKKMAVSWLKRLHVSYPHLAQLAEKMNKDDRFIMADERDDWNGKKNKKKKKSSSKKSSDKTRYKHGKRSGADHRDTSPTRRGSGSGSGGSGGARLSGGGGSGGSGSCTSKKRSKKHGHDDSGSGSSDGFTKKQKKGQ
ncbi:JMJD6 protein [Tribonema minus]|uniref:JMJD6 protein n=1 Tax=Tribonema minus TaxID=303371 RepID=A0A836CFU6_9STRA|nr:JMJD6 protein [Tribonema minus]